MNEEIINELLLQLEQSLRNIESARQQVENTVNAYEALNGDVRHYTEELSFIVQNTRTMISQLEEIKEKFLGNISVTIIERINSGVSEIKTDTDALSTQIGLLRELIESKSRTISDDIKNRSDSIDSALGTIQHTINSIASKTDKTIAKLDEIKATLNTLVSNEDKHFKEIEKKLDAQEEFIYRELAIIRKQNIILFAINAILLLAILGFVLHISGIL